MKLKYIALLILIIRNFYQYLFPELEDCLMISFGGYTGFWYYYSILKKENLNNKKIYCYSAGCLASIARIEYNNYNSLIKVVNDLKKKYQENKINRFDIRNEFINKIVKKRNIIKHYNLNILTSNYIGDCNIIKPKNKKELIDALNMTTSVPFMTSKFDYSQNIDGFFCRNKYPQCKSKLSMPISFKFYKNILNPNMNEENEIKYFMNYE